MTQTPPSISFFCQVYKPPTTTTWNRDLFPSSMDRYLEQGVCLAGRSHVNGAVCYCGICWPVLTNETTLPFLYPGAQKLRS